MSDTTPTPLEDIEIIDLPVIKHGKNWDSTAIETSRMQTQASRLAEYIDPAVGITAITSESVAQLQNAVEAAEVATEVSWEHSSAGTDVYDHVTVEEKTAMDRVSAAYQLFKNGSTDAERAVAARALRSAAQKANLGTVAAGRAVFSAVTMRKLLELTA